MTSTAMPATARPDARRGQRPVTFTGSGPYFAALFLVALVAFWPTYLSQVTSSTGYTHLHALTAATWMAMLVAQPLAIRTRRLALHRTVGRLSYGVAPLVVVSMLLLAHSKTHGATDADLLGFYVPLSLAGLFGVSYALAIGTRRNMALHARFMVCTGLTLIDPVGVRLLYWAYPTPSFQYQWITFALTDAVFLALIWRDRPTRAGRWVFPVMLLVFAASQLVFFLRMYEARSWAVFMQWFAALPLT